MFLKRNWGMLPKAFSFFPGVQFYFRWASYRRAFNVFRVCIKKHPIFSTFKNLILNLCLSMIIISRKIVGCVEKLYFHKPLSILPLKNFNVGSLLMMSILTFTGLIPLFGIDVWEHAYYLQYKNVRPDYVKAIFEVANWNNVSKRYEEALASA